MSMCVYYCVTIIFIVSASEDCCGSMILLKVRCFVFLKNDPQQNCYLFKEVDEGCISFQGKALALKANT